MNKNRLAIIAFAISFTLMLITVLGVRALNSPAIISESSNDEDNQVFALRETAYHELIEEANLKIETLNQQILSERENSFISPDNMILFAQSIVSPDFILNGPPELIQFEERIAYILRYDLGNVIFDANSGDLLFSDIPQKISADQAADIAIQYIGNTDLKTSNVSETKLDGVSVFEVRLGSYIVFVDYYGAVVKAQRVQYVTASNPVVSNPSSREHDDDHEHEEDDD